MSARKSSHRTIFLIVSSGSPLALIASSLRSTSKNPVCPMARSLHPPMAHCGQRVRFVATWREEFFKVPFNDLSDSPSSKPWIIKNVMARNETSSWISPPGKGKSALLTDIAVHVAAGEDWRGHRVKQRAGVVYFALERAALTNRRF